jgi:hypothetical protein
LVVGWVEGKKDGEVVRVVVVRGGEENDEWWIRENYISFDSPTCQE